MTDMTAQLRAAYEAAKANVAARAPQAMHAGMYGNGPDFSDGSELIMSDEDMGGYEVPEALEIGSESGEETIVSFLGGSLAPEVLPVSGAPAPIFEPMVPQRMPAAPVASQPVQRPQKSKAEEKLLLGAEISHPALQRILEASKVPDDVLAAHQEAFPMDAEGEDFDRLWGSIASRGIIMWVAPKFPGTASVYRQHLIAVFVRPLVNVERRTVKGVAAIPLSAHMHRFTLHLARHRRRVVYSAAPQINPENWPTMAREVYMQTIDAMARLRASVDKPLPKHPQFPSLYALCPEPVFDPHLASIHKGGPSPLQQQRHMHIQQKGAIQKFLVPYRWTRGGSPVLLHREPATIIELGTGQVGGLEAADAYNVVIKVTL
jgi:hypothetical protein